MAAGPVTSARALVAALLVVGPATARAESIAQVEAITLYDGALYGYEVNGSSGTVPYDVVDVTLPGAAVLVGIEALPTFGDPVPVLDEGALVSECGGAPPYACPSARPVPDGIGAVFTVQPTAVGAQHVTIFRTVSGSPSADLDWLVRFRLYVRLNGGGSCASDPTATFDNTAAPSPIAPSAALCPLGALPTLAVIRASTGPLVTHREATPMSLIWTWEGVTSTAQLVTINGDVTFSCSPSGRCSDGDPGQVLRLTSTGTFPATVSYDVLNTPNPPVGDVVVTVSAAHAHRTEPSAATVTIQALPVASFALDLAAPNSGVRALSAGDSVQLQPSDVRNEHGGFEYPAFTYAAIAPTDVTDLATAQSWIDASGALAIPRDLDTTGTLTVEGVPVTPQSGSVRHSLTFNVAPGPPGCTIHVPQASVLAHSRVDLTLMAPTRGATYPFGSVTWSVVGGGDADVAEDLTNEGRAELMLGEGLGVVTVRADTAACRNGYAQAQVQVQPALRLLLTAERQRVAPGEAVLLDASVENVSELALAGVRLRWALDGALQPLGDGPRGSSVVRVATPWSREGVLRAAWWELDLPASGREAMTLPVVAKALAGGGRVRARVQAYYAADLAADSAPIAEAEVQIQVAGMPEMSEPTLFGRVFVDENDNGTPDDGESGVAGAVVALAAGIYAVTDDLGRYHINRIDAGRHVVKLDPGSLPLGAQATTRWRRELTLTPGVFTVVNFGVRLPRLGGGPSARFVPTRSGIRIDGAQLKYAAAFELAPGHRLVALSAGVDAIGAKSDASTSVLELPLRAEAGEWILVESHGDGRRWLSRFTVHEEEQRGGVRWAVPRGPTPLLGMLLPGDDVAVNGSGFNLLARAYGAANMEAAWKGEATACTVTFEGAASASQPDWRCALSRAQASAELVVRIDPAPDELGLDAPAVELVAPIRFDATSHFMVGRAEATLHRDFAHDDRDARLWDAGGAFFYRGAYGSGMRLTAGADGTASDLLYGPEGKLRSGGGMLARLLQHDPQRIFRDLDPEQYYPTYGDQARVVDEREAGGRLFARLESDAGYVKWGGINTAIDDAEVGRYVRSLYGLGAQVSIGDATSTPTVHAVAFAARPTSSPARDELPLTGGSLYFLAHRDIVQGSLRVSLEVLDPISRLPVRAVMLTEGADYEADYLGGRIVLEPAVAARLVGQSLTQPGGTGHRGTLLVDYEYVPGGALTRDWSVGGRVVAGAGGATLGATAVSELGGGAVDGAELERSYTLLGATGRLDWGEALRLRLELAHSDGGSFAAARSIDGGLSFADAATADGRAGNAMVVEVAAGHKGSELAIYGRRIERGFADARTTPGERRLQAGARVKASVAAASLWLQVDELHQEPDGQDEAARRLALAGARYRFGRADLALEGRHEESLTDDSRREVAGAELGVQATSHWRLSLRRRQLLAGGQTGALASSTRGETALGTFYEGASGTGIGGEVGAGDDSRVFGSVQGSTKVSDDTRLYLGFLRESHLANAEVLTSRNGTRVVAGGRRSEVDGTSVYAEQHVQVDGSDRRASRLAGAAVPVGRRTQVTFSYERGEADAANGVTGRNRRDAVALGGLYAGERLQARVGGDARLDERALEPRKAQLGVQGRLDLRVSDELQLAGALRGASSYDEPTSRRIARESAWEGSAGFALRPLGTGPLTLFGRYAYGDERRRVSQDEATLLRERSHLGALSAVVAVGRWADLAPKVAYRVSKVAMDATAAVDRALLAVLRGDVHVWDAWDATVEGRACTTPAGQEPKRYGALAEASTLALPWVRLGVGYNFSTIAASGVRCHEPGARGLYLRAEAVY